MGTTLVEIEEYLNKHKLRFMTFEERDFIALGFPTKSYTDKDGDNHLTIIISIEEKGEYIKFFAPRCYIYDGEYKETLFQYLLMMCFRIKMIQFDYDPEDGEVRAIIEFPLEDNNISERQCMRILLSLVESIDEIDTVIRLIMKGEVTTEALSSTGRLLHDTSTAEDKTTTVHVEDAKGNESEDSDDFDEI